MKEERIGRKITWLSSTLKFYCHIYFGGNEESHENFSRMVSLTIKLESGVSTTMGEMSLTSYPSKDEAQTVLFKDPVRTAL